MKITKSIMLKTNFLHLQFHLSLQAADQNPTLLQVKPTRTFFFYKAIGPRMFKEGDSRLDTMRGLQFSSI